MTRIVSASRIVESRCAITKLVRPFISRAIARWMSTSVRVSTELVASSRMRIRGSARNARAIVSSCFSPGRDVGGVVVEDGVVAVGQRAHEVVDVGRLGGRDDLLLGGVLAAVGDVLADRAAEQPGVLQHHAEGPAQVVAGHLAGVDAVDGDAPAVDLVEAHQQVDERRLAGAGRADDRDRLAGLARRGPGPR